MNIYKLQNTHNQFFKGAIVNINALSDTHGELLLADKAIGTLNAEKEDVFCKEGKGRANITAVCGDWFMDGGRDGYSAFPSRKLAEFQLRILNIFFSQINKIAPQKANLFVIGNHELDGGVNMLAKVLKKIKPEVIATNLDYKNSPALKDSIGTNKVIPEKIVEVDDDKDPNQTHKLLFLGIMPVNMQKYQMNLDGINFTDNINKAQADVEREDYEKTIELCKKRINEFKEKNKNGIVVLLSHTGVDFADNLAKEAEVDIVFDAHEHKDEIRESNGTPIIPLSQNFEKIVNAKLIINDNGKLENIKLKNIRPSNSNNDGLIHRYYTRLFQKDIKKSFSIKTDNPNIKELDIKNIRSGNNYLANFVTDSILKELQKHNSSVDFLALNASAIRHPLPISDEASISMFDVMNVLSGITDNDGQLMTTEVSGEDIAYMIADNYIFSQNNPEKNPIIHYSGLIIDRTMIMHKIKNGCSYKDLTKYIIDARTNKPIQADKSYTIANPVKYFNKSKNPWIQAMKEKSHYTGFSISELFKAHFKTSNGKLTANCDTRIK